MVCFFFSVSGTGKANTGYIGTSILQRTDTLKKKKTSKNKLIDTLVTPPKVASDSIKKAITENISSFDTVQAIVEEQNYIDTIKTDSTKVDSLKTSKFIDEIIYTKNKDSMVMDMKKELLHLYKEAEIKYSANDLTANYMNIDLKTNNIFAKGHIDSTTGNFEKTTFKDKGIDYKMDSITFNMKTEKGKIYGVFFKESEGFVHGENVKKVDNVMNIKGAKYTTCDAEHPHFYLQSTKAQYIDDKGTKKIVIGTSYVVLEDVPLPLILPFGFFPLMTDRSSGIIIPSFGEETAKGFFLRDGGWYQVINNHLDAAITGGIYTLGSWNLRLSSSYSVRYKFKGNLSFDFAKDILGSKGDPNYTEMTNYSIKWSHSQDPKARPGSSFAASVNFASSNYGKYQGNYEESGNTQSNSSISYSKTWIGTPFSLSSSMNLSQNNRDSSINISMPNLVFNVNRFYPFKRRKKVGEDRWYEKIGMSYNLNFNNNVNTKQKYLLKKEMFDKMQYGFKHTIPITTSFTILKFLNISPSFNYNEKWYFDKIERTWNPETKKLEETKINEFNRLYDFNASVDLTSTIYGMYTFKKESKVQAIRHVMTPRISFSYTPNFGADSYGYYKPVQVDTTGRIEYYSPFEKGIFGVPSRGETASMGFDLSNNLEMKVRSDKDSTGVKKVTILENLSLNTRYNFLADSMNLDPISFSARTTLFKSLGVEMGGQWDLYYYDELGRRTKKFAWANGSAGRITNFRISLAYSLRSVLGFSGSNSGTGSGALPPEVPGAPLQGSGLMGSPSINEQQGQQALANAKYYNFSIPWNVTMNYTFNMNNTGAINQISQTLALNGSLNITQKWAVTVNTSIDLTAMKLATSSVSVIRDLHCWQMSISWIPVGFRSSWSFNINVKSSVLQDLKLKKSSNFLDNYYSTY